jgi:hypothetical protein
VSNSGDGAFACLLPDSEEAATDERFNSPAGRLENGDALLATIRSTVQGEIRP